VTDELEPPLAPGETLRDRADKLIAAIVAAREAKVRRHAQAAAPPPQESHTGPE
jgi:hypothetical protein